MRIGSLGILYEYYMVVVSDRMSVCYTIKYHAHVNGFNT